MDDFVRRHSPFLRKLHLGLISRVLPTFALPSLTRVTIESGSNPTPMENLHRFDDEFPHGTELGSLHQMVIDTGLEFRMIY